MASEPWLDRHIFNESEMALFSECMLCVLKKCLIPPALFESRCFANCPSSVYKIGHFSGADCDIIDNVKARKPTLKQVQAVQCPSCGAGPGEKCELSAGHPRTQSHRDRRLLAAD